MPDLRRAPVFRSGALQFDPVGQHNAAYTAQRRRDSAARTAENYPGHGPGPRTRTRDGYPVHVRNGLSFRPYRYRGAGHDIMECECHA
jgi:hypothetical protein